MGHRSEKFNVNLLLAFAALLAAAAGGELGLRPWKIRQVMIQRLMNLLMFVWLWGCHPVTSATREER